MLCEPGIAEQRYRKYQATQSTKTGTEQRCTRPVQRWKTMVLNRPGARCGRAEDGQRVIRRFATSASVFDSPRVPAWLLAAT